MMEWPPGIPRWQWHEEQEDEEEAREAARWGTPKETRVHPRHPLDPEMTAKLAGLLDVLAARLLFLAIDDTVSFGESTIVEGDSNRLFAAAHAIRTEQNTLDSAEAGILGLRLFSKIGREGREVIIEWIASARLPEGG